MTMSKDRVRFFLQSRYFQCRRTSNGMRRSTCLRILEQVFALDVERSNQMIAKNPEGFWIICRPSQFARFIVARHDANECINGIKDLKPTIFQQQDLYTRLARQFCVPKDTVVGLSRALGYHHGDDSHVARCQVNFVDVSMNLHIDDQQDP